ncbi:hypothetical protein LUZ60_000466 [Juncus effusus]|nr:hypothetical protein LUZ60_000466 [Juncus effusus]
MYNVSVRSTLAPILNALEVYMVNPVILLPTDTQDVTAINAIKGNYSVNKGWSGDPCLPTNLSWTGVSCTLTSSNIPQITGLYPDDPLDRLWLDNTQQPWTEISTTNVVKTDTSFQTPSRVLQTAAASSTITDSLDLLWTLDASNNFFALLHISETQALKTTDYRAFNIYANGELLLNDSYVPEYLQSGWVNFTSKGKTNYNVSFKATKNSTLPPIINAFELYLIMPLTLLPTYPDDGLSLSSLFLTIVTTIKAHYGVNKTWSGDPCVPTWLAWSGVNCTLNASKIARITSLNLSSSGLTGTIISSFGNLTALQSLDLSRNNLLGTIPISLDQLTSLTFLDLSRNDKLNFTLPPGLQNRKDNGLLIVKTTEDPTDSSSVCSGSCDKKKISVTIIAIVVVIPVLVITSIVILILCWKRITNNIRINQHHGTSKNYGQLGDILKDSHGIPKRHGTEESILHFESRKFTFIELKTLTNNFQDKIGTGGFGSVFMGCLENRKQVAVKVLSQSSSQGVKEFMAEAQNLTRVHHKNLVSLFGYCMDGDHMALVYEYMPEGTLQDKLRDSARPLAWNQWLRIAQESAQGLEYLHKSCNPPLIHRDIKSSNILLTANLEAKIADFGLVRAFDSDGTHITTRVVGTPGYFDPDYYTTSQLTEKSDVYSFGVVLLEIATGQPPIIGGKQHITELVRQKLFEGDLESIIHERFEGQYDINSIQKVAKLGLKCTGEATRRPTMTSVVAELKECMKLEMSSEWIDSVVSG